MATGLTQQQKKAVRTSWEKYLANGISNGTAFYISWFEAHPDIAVPFKSLFKDLAITDPRNGPKLRAQAKVFNDAMASFVDNLDDAECLTVLVQKVAKNHFRMGVKLKQFEDGYGHFVNFLQKNLHIDGPTKEAWDKTVAIYLQITKGLA